MTFDYKRDPQDPNILSLFYARRPRHFRNNSQLVRPVPVFFFYVKIWTKTKSYVCFIMCDMLLKDMHIGIFNLLVLQTNHWMSLV